MVLRVRTLTVSLPRTIAEIPRRPWEAITIKSHSYLRLLREASAPAASSTISVVVSCWRSCRSRGERAASFVSMLVLADAMAIMSSFILRFEGKHRRFAELRVTYSATRRSSKSWGASVVNGPASRAAARNVRSRWQQRVAIDDGCHRRIPSGKRECRPLLWYRWRHSHTRRPPAGSRNSESRRRGWPSGPTRRALFLARSRRLRRECRRSR